MATNPHPENQPDDKIAIKTVEWLETRVFTKARERQFLEKRNHPIGQSELEWAMYNEIVRLRAQVEQLLAPHYVVPDVYTLPPLTTEPDSKK